ncbi:tyrosine-type recombinase/integrase [Ruegeria arenilitoris]|uniref:tyrosine-type recombinase/integrase n=1 Tax=Ruegeria arenilitoris TaxID=1173585 RepID=UPI0020C47C93|nr:tyrosine-type recombinase/integrase [Ruegeria arenilitoris]
MLEHLILHHNYRAAPTVQIDQIDPEQLFERPLVCGQNLKGAIPPLKPRTPSQVAVGEWAGEPMKSIKKGFKAAAVAAGLPDVSPHVLRRTAAVHMAEAGIPMDEIAQFLGHSDTRITASVYARYSPEHLRKAASALEFD